MSLYAGAPSQRISLFDCLIYNQCAKYFTSLFLLSSNDPCTITPPPSTQYKFFEVPWVVTFLFIIQYFPIPSIRGFCLVKMSLRVVLMAVVDLIWRFRVSLIILFPAYLLLVHCLRYQRSHQIKSMFSNNRPLSTMTTKEAHEIMTQLQELEFPYAFNKARRIALLKVSSIIYIYPLKGIGF